ncbi:MAG: HAD family hydrolase, partial [Chloroflexota bacterium]|nr:HAD family hydrolase [Chloroflexota bacterium]
MLFDLDGTLVDTVEMRISSWVEALALAVAALAVAALPLGGIAALAGVSSFAALLGFAAVNLALIVLRRREPTRERPFRVPLSVGGIPVLPALGIA